MKSKIRACLVSLLAVAPLCGLAIPAPRYLSVPQFQSCLSIVSEGTFSHWCMPSTKPAACPDDSWTALQDPNNSVPACSKSSS